MNRILLGQRLAFGFEGTCIPENFAALVREYKIGNVTRRAAWSRALRQTR